MQIKRIDAHDRLLELQKQSDYISEGFLECVKNRPEEFENHPFYVFAHKREIGIDERIAIYNNDLYSNISDPSYGERKYKQIGDVPTHRMIWEPRLTKPLPQENSMLFKHYPSDNTTDVFWILPDKALWGQYEKGNMTESNIVCESIYQFKNNSQKMASPEENDMSDETIDQIYRQISLNAQRKRKGYVKI